MMLYQLPVGGVFELKKHVRTDRTEKFIEIVKTYIDRNVGHSGGWYIEFSNDYKKIKKKKLHSI